jgi:deoxyribonuclease V
MLIAIDVHYRETFAKTISIEFNNWEDAIPTQTHEVIINEVAEYVSGEFYKREMPCILEILKCSEIDKIDLIIIDGYVFLDDDNKFGLGAYLYEALGRNIPIVGIAKRNFINNKKNVVEVLRGESKNPIFVTAIGIDLIETTKKVKNMHGIYRIPDLLKLLDRMTKE